MVSLCKSIMLMLLLMMISIILLHMLIILPFNLDDWVSDLWQELEFASEVVSAL